MVAGLLGNVALAEMPPIGAPITASNGDTFHLEWEHAVRSNVYALKRVKPNGESQWMWRSFPQAQENGGLWLFGLVSSYEGDGELSLLGWDYLTDAVVFHFPLTANTVEPVRIADVRNGSSVSPQEGSLKNHGSIELTTGEVIQFDPNGAVTFHSGRVGRKRIFIEGPKSAPIQFTPGAYQDAVRSAIPPQAPAPASKPDELREPAPESVPWWRGDLCRFLSGTLGIAIVVCVVALWRRSRLNRNSSP
jgi:hypothetical protein